MTITLVFLACLMAAVVWWLLRQSLNVEPWAAQGAAVQDVYADVLARPPAKTALIVFLAVATSLFALFISAYAMRIQFGDWQPLPEPRLLTWNTAVLVASSLAMQWAVVAARRSDQAGVRKGLAVGGALAALFLLGQLLVWQQLSEAGYFVASSAATGFFYLLTAVHGAHVIGGLVAWWRSATRARSKLPLPRLRLGVELCAIYWHFLLLVWIVLFAVLAFDGLGLAICVSPAAS
jgi:cytochrome c oxidase subunit 3